MSCTQEVAVSLCFVFLVAVLPSGLTSLFQGHTVENLFSLAGLPYCSVNSTTLNSIS